MKNEIMFRTTINARTYEITLSLDVVATLESVGDPALIIHADLESLLAHATSEADFLTQCLAGAEGEYTRNAWREYVAAIYAAISPN